MSDHKIETTGPVPCPKCGEGLMLAFARPSLKAGEKPDKQFSHYENYYKCSRCGYEMRQRKGNMNMMKEGKHELDQDEVDDDGEDGDNGDEVDSRQRRRDLK